MSGALPVAGARRTLAELARTAGSEPRAVLAALLWTVLAAAGTVLAPLLLGHLVDAVRTGTGFPGGRFAALTVAVPVAALGAALARRAVDRLGARVAARLREAALTRALALPAPVLESAGPGDVASRVTEDVEDFVAAVPLFTEVLIALTTVVVAGPGFLSLNPWLALAFASVLPVYTISLILYLPRSARLYAAERRRAAERSRVLLESLHGRETVLAYGMGPLQTRRVATASKEALLTGVRAVRLYVWFSKAMNAAEAIGLCAILLAGYALVRDATLTVGAATAAALLFHRLFGPLGTLLLSFDDVQRAGAALARTVGVLQVPLAPAGERRAPRGGVEVAVTGLSHAYGDGPPVVERISVTVPSGTSLALVGASGAGKTTLANLIAGVLPTGGGRITLRDAAGPIGVDALDADALRNWVGLVAQETHTFSGPVRDGLTLAGPGADDAGLIAALEAAGAAGWVRRLPAGLDTVVGDGVLPLSPAQAQHLALARLILRNPPVVVLDEATAEAGSAHADELDRAAAATIDGRTAIVVAHRLSQARACDRIAVLAGGRIAELGSHDELMSAGGRYASLYEAWSGGRASDGP